MPEQLKKPVVLLGAVIMVVVAAFFLLKRPTVESAAPASELAFSTSQSTVATTETSSAELFVDVKGAVNHGGMYRLKAGMRLMDAIELAGGFTAEADQTRMNFAKLLTDQEVIYVPKVGEDVPEQLAAPPDPTGSVTGGDQAASEGGKINLNTADEKQLQELSGIGEKRAQDILKYREENGSFQAVEDLTKVSGIGEKTLENLKDSITIK